MNVRINRTIVAPLAMLCMVAIIWIAIPYCIAEGSGSSSEVGPRMFPQMVCVCIAALSVVQLILAACKQKKAEYFLFDFAIYGRVILAAVFMIAAVVCAYIFNLIIVAVVCAMLLLLILGVKNYKYYLAVVITGGVLYLLMHFVMHIKF